MFELPTNISLLLLSVDGKNVLHILENADGEDKNMMVTFLNYLKSQDFYLSSSERYWYYADKYYEAYNYGIATFKSDYCDKKYTLLIKTALCADVADINTLYNSVLISE